MLFGAVEIGLSCLGKYETKEKTYKSVSRAISAFGMAVCFIVLIGAFDAAVKAST